MRALAGDSTITRGLATAKVKVVRAPCQTPFVSTAARNGPSVRLPPELTRKAVVATYLDVLVELLTDPEGRVEYLEDPTGWLQAAGSGSSVART